MDKKVGSLDLDELKKAREELDRERGIETDPHMYDNYNPESPLSSSREYVEFLFLEKIKEECKNIEFMQNFKKNNEILY